MNNLQKLLMELHGDMDALVLSKLHSLIWPDIKPISLLDLNLVDKDLLEEVQAIQVTERNIAIYFGDTLRDIKCIIKDVNIKKDHVIIIHNKGPKKLTIVSVSLPYSPIQDEEYVTLEGIITAYRSYIYNLAPYFYELNRIDNFCFVKEPLNPSFKDDYRRILLDDKTSLHVEVTTAGLPRNIHVVGQSQKYNDKLQLALLAWDHDKDILDNIMSGLDIKEFPVPSHRLTNNAVGNVAAEESPTCGICLCDELPDDVGLPLALCQNDTCGVYYHRNCLYQWLVACSGGRAPPFGVANGQCPTCLQPIACCEKESY